jgi:dTDP-4-dehydrorhamnose reductase
LTGAAASALGPWLVIGGSGLFGHGLCRYLVNRGGEVTATANKHTIDVPGIRQIAWSPDTNELLHEFIGRHRPRTVVYAAGITSVDFCQSNEQLADMLHAQAPATLASRMVPFGCRFIYISTDHLWDGTRSMVGEDQPVSPVNAYARSKAKGEQMVQAADPNVLILRTNFFGPGRPWRLSLSDWYLERLNSGEKFFAFSDAYFTPIALPLLYEIIVDVASIGLDGIYHACGSERLSKYEFAVRLARWRRLPQDGIRPGHITDAGLTAPRPADMSLSTQKLSNALGRDMPTITNSFTAIFGQSAGT